MTYRKVCIVGPGAIGGMMAVMLKRAGVDVSAFARPAKAAAIAKDGLTLETGGARLTANFPVASDADALGPQDLVIVTLKSNAVSAVAPAIAALCGPATPIVFVMNGLPWWFFDGFGGPLAGRALTSLDPGGILRDTIPLHQTLWGVINCSVIERADGVIEHTRNEHLILGRPNDDPTGLDPIGDVFRRGGYEAVISPKIRNDLWAKLVVNVSANPVSALTGATLGQMYADPLVAACVAAIADEARALGERLGLAATANPVDRMKDSPVRTSMLQDFERGRPLELASIVEAVVEIGEAADMPMPQTRAILGMTRLRAALAGVS